MPVRASTDFGKSWQTVSVSALPGPGGYPFQYRNGYRLRTGPDGSLVTVAGMHCESGDILITDAMLASPEPGDILVTPATGAYGYSMASNYNGAPRPAVVFCKDGVARVVVRRETWDDLVSRDM